MLNILIFKITGLAIIMAAGFFLVRFGPLTREDTKSLSRLTCYLVMPCNIFCAFQVSRTPETLRGLSLVLVGAVLVHCLFLLTTKLLQKPLGLSPTEQASVFCTNAGNLIVPLVTAMLGREWVIYCCAYMLVQNILLWSHVKNLVCGETGIAWKSLLTNPNIMALMAGSLLFLLGISLPPLLEDTIYSVGSMVGPIAMLVIGMTIGSLELKSVFCRARVWMAAGLRLLLYPALALGLLKLLCLVFPMGGPYFLVTMLAASAPSAAIITHICQLHGKNPQASSAICTVTTTFCVLTIPLMIWLYELICL